MLRTRPCPRALPLALLALLTALLAAACGGASGTSAAIGAAGTDGKAAQAVPADTLLFLDANIDQGSDAWKKLEALGSRFPDWPNLTAELRRSLTSASSDGVSFEKDIRPWLGGEAGLAVTSVAPSATSMSGVFVAYLQSTDDGKLAAALQKGGKAKQTGSRDGYDLYTASDASGSATYAAVGRGAMLVSNRQSALARAIDAREGKTTRLADLDRFQAALAELPKDNLVVGYVDGPALAQLADVALAQAGTRAPQGSAQQLEQLRSQLAAFRAASFSFGAEDHGFRFRAATLLDKAKAAAAGLTQKPFTPSLLGNVPATAFAYAGFQNLGPSLQRLLQQASATPGVGGQVQSLEQQSGISLAGDLVPLLSGEHALFAGAGTPFSAGLLLHPADPAKGAETLRKLTAAVAKQAPGFQPAPLPSGTGERVTVQPGLAVQWRKAGDVLAISNDPAAGDAQGSSLRDSAAFKRVRAEAGQSGDVTGLLYADIPAMVDFAASLGQPVTDPQVKANLSHIGPFLAWGAAKDDGTLLGDAFLEVR